MDRTTPGQAPAHSSLPLIIEIALVVLWALVVARPLLNLDPEIIPAGREYGFSVQSHHLWTEVQACGTCAFWSGNTAGGYPAFVNLHGSMLHPIVIATTLPLGVNNGAKIGLVLAIIMAGLGQLWLGRELGMSSIARVWTACMAVAGGHLGARMENGNFAIVLATAAATVAMAATFHLGQRPGRRAAGLMALALASLLLAGQGYYQLGFAALLVPGVVILFGRDRRRWSLFAQAAGLSFLLAAPFLVPLLHFYANFVKPVDPGFGGSQPMAYLPLNLVIPDWGYYITQVLGKSTYPYLYTLFVGWWAVLLALLGAGVVILLRRGVRQGAVLMLWLVLAFWIAGAQPLRWLLSVLPKEPRWQDLIAQFRFVAMVSGLAVPPLLALAGLGLDYLFGLDWQISGQAGRETGSARRVSLDLHWLLAIPLAFALLQGLSFSRNGLRVVRLDQGMYQVLEAMRTPTMEWINPPFGEMGWQEIIPRLNMKMALAYWPWGVRDHPIPQTVLTADRLGTPPGMTLEQRVAKVGIFRSTDPAREYATVAGPAGLTVCQAQGRSGELSVTCDSPADGTLKIQEYLLPGWYADLDGTEATLLPGPWLSTSVPAGKHTISLHYRPWDAPLGLALCVLGLVLTGYYLVDPRPQMVSRRAEVRPEPPGNAGPPPELPQEFQI